VGENTHGNMFPRMEIIKYPTIIVNIVFGMSENIFFLNQPIIPVWESGAALCGIISFLTNDRSAILTLHQFY
jgi:hypothetical protein